MVAGEGETLISCLEVNSRPTVLWREREKRGERERGRDERRER
jgi:hypothetical protein